MTDEIRLALFAFLAFLLPIGIYCFVLAGINRRSRPLLVHGSWDAIGLLFAVSGFFLATVPVLANQFYHHLLGFADLEFSPWIGWLAYFLLILGGGGLMIFFRANKTMVYNVDPEQFAAISRQTFAALGLEIKTDRNRLILVPARSNEPSSAITEARPTALADHRYAELAIESFASMSHVTLHWGRCTPDLRAELERELEKNLEPAAPLENSASAWFVSISVMIFGAVLVVLAMFIVMIVLSRRWI
jgi:hypothetical protein